MKFAPDQTCSEILSQEFGTRHARNPRFSMRSFAKFLNVAPSTLSEILRDKHGLSGNMAQQFAERLDYEPRDQEYFVALAEKAFEKSETARSRAKQIIDRYRADYALRIISDDTLKVITQWHHYAILELVELDGFRNDANWIAQALDLSEATVKLALQRLKALSLLVEEKGALVVKNNMTATPTDIPSHVRRNYHEAILLKAHRALGTQAPENRDFSAITFSLNKSQLDELRMKLRDFRREIMRSCAQDKNRNGIYCMSIQLFDLAPNLELIFKTEEVAV